jgi:predicted N-acetyltransferase YhbS
MSDSLSAPTPLGPDHLLADFSCGIPELDDWLLDRSRRNERNDVSRTFVVSRGMQVVGYYALAAGAVARVDAPKSLSRNSPDPIPVFLLGRLAVDHREQGSGLGGFLLRDALIRCVRSADSVGARAVMVDAISDDAIAFYRRYEFIPSPIHPTMLFLPMSFIRRQLEEAIRAPDR